MYKIQTPDDFLSTPWRMTIFDSCVMRLQTIGEYVKKIDDKTNKQLLPKYPQVPWVKVIGQRNIISHEYSAVDEEKIFITISVITLLAPEVCRPLHLQQTNTLRRLKL